MRTRNLKLSKMIKLTFIFTSLVLSNVVFAADNIKVSKNSFLSTQVGVVECESSNHKHSRVVLMPDFTSGKRSQVAGELKTEGAKIKVSGNIAKGLFSLQGNGIDQSVKTDEQHELTINEATLKCQIKTATLEEAARSANLE